MDGGFGNAGKSGIRFGYGQWNTFYSVVQVRHTVTDKSLVMCCTALYCTGKIVELHCLMVVLGGTTLYRVHAFERRCAVTEERETLGN